MSRDRNSSSSRAVGGEHRLPLEHTQRVRVQAENETSDSGGDHAPTGAADRTRRARRRERDALAERRAIQIVMTFFVGFGALGFVVLHLLDSGASAGGYSEKPANPRMRDSLRSAEVGQREKPNGRHTSSELLETPRLPALRALEMAGLTVAAEGLPKVNSLSRASTKLAGREACRFAYGVWEFSPNQTFRFLSTCKGLGRLELIGAYEVRGTKVFMSEVGSSPVRWTSVFEVQKPAKMESKIMVSVGTSTHRFEVSQRVTVVRTGLHGDDFRDSFSRKNRLTLPRLQSESPESKKDPLEELLGG